MAPTDRVEASPEAADAAARDLSTQIERARQVLEQYRALLAPNEPDSSSKPPAST
jgi:hypothetical protein